MLLKPVSAIDYYWIIQEELEAALEERLQLRTRVVECLEVVHCISKNDIYTERKTKRKLEILFSCLNVSTRDDAVNPFRVSCKPINSERESAFFNHMVLCLFCLEMM